MSEAQSGRSWMFATHHMTFSLPTTIWRPKMMNCAIFRVSFSDSLDKFRDKSDRFIFAQTNCALDTTL